MDYFSWVHHRQNTRAMISNLVGPYSDTWTNESKDFDGASQPQTHLKFSATTHLLSLHQLASLSLSLLCKVQTILLYGPAKENRAASVLQLTKSTDHFQLHQICISLSFLCCSYHLGCFISLYQQPGFGHSLNKNPPPNNLKVFFFFFF